MDNQEQFEDVEEIIDVGNDGAESEMDEDFPIDGVEPEEDQEEMTEEIPDDSSFCFVQHSDSVYCVDFHPTERDIVISGGGDDKAFIWNVSTGQVIHQLIGHTDSIVAVQFSFNGKLAATGGMEGVVKVWDVATGSMVAQLEGPDEITWICWHSKGSILLAGANDGSAWMWMSNGQVMQVFSGHSAPLTAGCFSPDGKLVVTGSEDGSVIVWDPKNASPIQKFTAADGRFNQAPITTVGFSNDSTLLLTGSQDGAIKAVHPQNGKILASLDGHSDSIECIEYSKIIPLVATCGMDGKLCVWEASNLKQRSVLIHDDGVVKAKWHPTEPLLISVSVDKTVRVWDARTGQCVRVFRGHTQPILDMSLSIDGRKIISASDDHTCLVFDS